MISIPARRFLTLENWYWIVAGSTTQVYSSAVGDYVPVADATYQAWLADGNSPTVIDTEANLGNVVAGLAVAPIPAAILDSYTSTQVDNIDKEKLRKLLFFMANQIRALQSQPPLTATQFKAFWKGL